MWFPQKKFLIEANFEIIKRLSLKDITLKKSTNCDEKDSITTTTTSTTTPPTAIDILNTYKQKSILLDSADLITYVCGSRQEVDELRGDKSNVGSGMKAFGSSYDEHLFMRIRKCDQLKSKTIFVTFNTNVKNSEAAAVVVSKTTHASFKTGETSNSSIDEVDRRPLLNATSLKMNSIIFYVLPNQSRQYLEHYFKRQNQLSNKNSLSSSPRTKFTRIVNKLLQNVYTTPFVRMIKKIFKVKIYNFSNFF